MQRILIDTEDSVAVCPHCRRNYGVSTGTLENVSVTRLPDGRYRYLLEEVESHGGRRLRKVETVQSLGLQVGSRLTLVRRGPILIGISDHSRDVWFSIEPAPSRMRGGRRFIDFMNAVIISCVILTTIGYALSIHGWVSDHGTGALVDFSLLAGFCVLVPHLSARAHERLSASADGQPGSDGRGMPPLDLPDIN